MAEPKTRIGSRLRVAITGMVEEALTRQDAAKKAGITDHALYCALRKPHVQAYRRELMEVLRSSESSKTFARVAKLADGAQSEHVRLQAAIHLGEVDGISPVQKGQFEHAHTHAHIIPGLTVVFGSDEVDGDVLDLEASDQPTPRLNSTPTDPNAPTMIGRGGGYRIGTPTPHPNPERAARRERLDRRWASQAQQPAAASPPAAPPVRRFPTPIRGDDDAP